MSLIVIALVAFSIVLDVIGQLCFKIGLDRLPELEGGFRLNAFWGQVFSAPMLWAGVGAYVIEFFVWLEALSSTLELAIPGRCAGVLRCGIRRQGVPGRTRQPSALDGHPGYYPWSDAGLHHRSLRS